MCWSDDDRGRNVLCDGCDCEYHTYCAEPPLEDIPQVGWFCAGSSEIWVLQGGSARRNGASTVILGGSAGLKAR